MQSASSRSNAELAWLAPWSFGCVTALEYLFITGLSSLIEEHDENALEDVRKVYLLEVGTKSFAMSRTRTYQRKRQCRHREQLFD